METKETWDLIEAKMLELRVLTNANWKNAEWELAALGERVLRTVEMCKAESKKLRDDYANLQYSIEGVKKEMQFKSIFKEEGK
jgi:hypothetical protein